MRFFDGILKGLVLLFIMPLCFDASAQRSKDVYVDKNGVMRWGDSKEEVYGFGVNYTAPFAHAYRSAKHLKVDLKKAIDEDVYHFARLGFDAYRVHVWDTEISDSTGNLLRNEHLDLFDYLLMRLKERNIKIFLTPIAFWGNGYPERDERTPGFASKYGKDACLTNPEAIKAQEKYLFQFLNHVNPYTKIAYKNDPDIVGFEVSNEPHHQGTPDEVSSYIRKMVASMRKTGCKKPILYNVSHSIHLSEAYYKAGIDGGTFQWYPTGLGARHELRGNFLPNVDMYTIPFSSEKGFSKGAKIVYEFDAADVGRSYIYPAMARSFREAGIQWATHFAYDPTFVAFANTEYNTHYMNLAYAPQKALSLKISSEVFHQIPLYSSFGRFPKNTTFGDFTVSYDDDLAQYVTKEKFYYTNNTTTSPPNGGSDLQEVAGAGSSPVVTYEGSGAYFLDKVKDGEWRLEVMPDAVWIDNLFSTNSLSKKVAVIHWKSWPMTISLPDLGDKFEIIPLKNQNGETTAEGKAFTVSPGVYLLVRSGKDRTVKSDDRLRNIRVDEFAAPTSNLDKTYVLHQTPYNVTTGQSFKVNAQIVSVKQIDSVKLVLQSGFRWSSITMKNTSGYFYDAEVPVESVKTGYINYHIVVFNGSSATSYPSGLTKHPRQWDFYGFSYSARVTGTGSKLVIFNAATDAEEVSREWRRGNGLLPGDVPGTASMLIKIDGLGKADPENKNAAILHDYSLRYNFAPKIAYRANELPRFTKVVVSTKATDRKFPVQVALIDSSGNAVGGSITLSPGKDQYELLLKELKPVKVALLPRPYPTFLPYFFQPVSSSSFNISRAETLQISVGPGIESPQGDYVLTLEKVTLE